MTIYDQQLDKSPANFVALSPVSFVERTAEVFGDLPAVVHGQRRYTWAQTCERSARLAAAGAAGFQREEDTADGGRQHRGVCEAEHRRTIDDDVIVVPVPDTAKAAADSMAFQLKVPSLEGLIRNRYIGRTFIEGNNRADKVRMKYTPLPEVMEGKRILLVDDSIVRATTLKELLALLKDRGRAKEIHVRIACPPIISPCFYGIDMSTVGELFAPAFMAGNVITPEEEQAMADAIGATSLRYLPVEALANCVGLPEHSLCQACENTVYPTPAGERMYQLALTKSNEERIACQNGGSPDEASGNRQRIYV